MFFFCCFWNILVVNPSPAMAGDFIIRFFNYLKDSFDVLYKEGDHAPKMMSIGLHCRLIGRPGRMQSLIKFINYVLKFDHVWICKRIDIAKHWIKNYQ